MKVLWSRVESELYPTKPAGSSIVQHLPLGPGSIAASSKDVPVKTPRALASTANARRLKANMSPALRVFVPVRRTELPTCRHVAVVLQLKTAAF